jgi:DNA-binding GntR family transcriptional regulator
MPLDSQTLRRPNRARLVDDVRQSLEEGILSGQIKPGERLIEADIAKHLDVSRTTIREALLMLERQGLVVTRPRRGTFVARLSRQDALDLGYARALLEGYAVRVGFAQIDAALLARLEQYVEKMAQCRLPRDLPHLIQLDLDFHRVIVEICASARIIELWSNLSGQIRALFITTFENQQATIDYIVDFHRQLIGALRSGDPATAQRGVLTHYVRDAAGDQATALTAVIDSFPPPSGTQVKQP